MKFAIIASLATAVAITNAQKAGVGLAAGEKCDYSLVGPTLHTLAVPIAECSEATNNIYNLARATAPPTPEQAATICAKCPTFVNAVNKLTWPECHMMMAGKNQTLTSYFDAMIGGCKPTADVTPVAAPVAKAGVGLAAGEKCDYSIVGPPLHKLAVPIAECSEATNNIYDLARATAPPTAEQSAAICAKCPSFVSAVSKLSWPECHMFMAGKNQTLTSYFDAMIGGCKATGEAVPAVAAVSVANSGVVGTRAGEKCDYSLVGPELHKLAQPIALCTEATDNIYNLARASAPATPEQSAAICAKCPAFVSAVTTRTWPSCFMDMGGKNQTLASYFDQMIGSCKINAVASTTVSSAGYSVKIGAFAAAAVAMTVASAL